jgi:hypothetical protein
VSERQTGKCRINIILASLRCGKNYVAPVRRELWRGFIFRRVGQLDLGAIIGVDHPYVLIADEDDSLPQRAFFVKGAFSIAYTSGKGSGEYGFRCYSLI